MTMPKTMTSIQFTRSISKIEHELEAHRDHAKQLAEQTEKLIIDSERRLARVRGTRDVTKEAHEASAEMSTSEICTQVERLLRERPMRFRELADSFPTIGEKRVSVAIVLLQRKGVKVVNLGEANKALWFVPDEDVLKRLRTKR